jgi:predicted membrane protein
METRQHCFFAPRFVLGLGIILVGILFLLGNLDILDPHDYFRYWPVLLIFAGIAHLIQSDRGSNRIWGIILVFVGSLMLLDRVYFFHFNLWDYWPLILVFIGIMMIVKSSFFRRDLSSSTGEINDSLSYIKATAIMGGFRRKSNSQNFKGGELTAIMGGLEIDLRDASINGEAVLDIFATMGGVEMRVPDDWLIAIEGFPFLGGYEDKTRPPKEATKRLIIKGTVVMGGVEIKN